jgi:pimeloyl-ACP methyl ester carboxylesterase
MCLAGFAMAAPTIAGPPSPVQPYLQPAERVRVDADRRLNLVCMGKGSPTVVFESGAGGTAADWRKVQPEVARFTRACAYDRAGYGFSDPADRPSDGANAVEDLRRLLQRARIGGPIVLVGHSVGGLYAELFAGTYPGDIAGLVLVDPTGLDDFGLVSQIISDDELKQQRANALKRNANYAHCLELARRGEAPVAPGGQCAPGPTGVPELTRVVRDQHGEAKYWEAYRSEMSNFYPSDYPASGDSVITSQVRAHPMRLGDKPLIYLKTPGRTPPGARGDWLRSASLSSAKRLVTASRRGKVVEVDSGHYIQLEHPDVVVAAVREAVDASRH